MSCILRSLLSLGLALGLAVPLMNAKADDADKEGAKPAAGETAKKNDGDNDVKKNNEKSGAKKAKREAARKAKREAAGKKKGGKREDGAFRLPETVKLTPEQQAKLDELKREYGPKLSEAAQKVKSVFSAESKKAMREAEQTAKASGKKGKELREAVMNAVKLTDAEKAQMQAARDQAREVQMMVRSAVRDLLTEAQQAEIKAAGKAKKNQDRPNKKQKKAAAEAK